MSGGERAGLTAHRRQVLQLAAHGYGNKGIAYVLGISEQTVKNTFNEINHALRTRNRTQAVVVAWRRGWIW